MNVIVQAKSIPVTRALRQFVTDHARKVARFSGRVSQVTVYLEKMSKRKSNDPSVSAVKFHVKVPGKDIVVKRKAVDMYEAIVETSDRAIRQVRKLKEKRQDKRRHQQIKFEQAQAQTLLLSPVATR